MTQKTSVRAPDAPKQGAIIRVTSESFTEGGKIPMDHVYTGCGGKNISPQLSWSGAPEGTKSFAVSCFDPDAPTGCGYWHWLVANIPPNVMSLKAGQSVGVTCRTDYGEAAYGGPCPPKGDGDHHYIFTVYALDVDTLAHASAGLSGAPFNFVMRGHLLATGTITGLFGH